MKIMKRELEMTCPKCGHNRFVLQTTVTRLIEQRPIENVSLVENERRMIIDFGEKEELERSLLHTIVCCGCSKEWSAYNHWICDVNKSMSMFGGVEWIEKQPLPTIKVKD